MQVLHLHSAQTVPAAPPDLLPRDPRRVGPARAHGARPGRPLRPAPGDPLADPRH